MYTCPCGRPAQRGTKFCMNCGAVYPPDAMVAQKVARRPLRLTTQQRQIAAGGGAVGGLLIALGSGMPWISAIGLISTSVAGTDGDGKITIVGGMLVVLLAIFILAGDAWRADVPLLLGGALLTALIVVACVYEYVHITQKISEATQSSIERLSVGSGIYLLGFGAVLGFCVMCGMLMTAWQAAGE